MRREIEQGGQAVGRSGGRWSRFAAAMRRVIGAPDYEGYLEHCRQAGHAVHLTEAEYVAEFFEQRGKRARCC